MSYGEGFSPAFGPGFAFAARPQTLRPELARGVELGAKGQWGPASYALAVYRLDRRDLAEWVQPTLSTTLAFANVGRQRSDGLEVETEWRLGDAWRAYANYAHVRSRWLRKAYVDPDTGAAYDFSGLRVAGVPAHTLALGARWSTGGWEVHGGMEAASDVWVDPANTARRGAHTLWHAGARYRWAGTGWELRVLVRNLFDRRWYAYVGTQDGPSEAIAGEPRAWSATLSYRF